MQRVETNVFRGKPRFFRFGANPRQVLGRKAVRIGVILFPVWRASPDERRLPGRARRSRVLQKRKREKKRLFLRGRVVRPPGGVPQGEIAEQKARDAAIFDDIVRAAQDHGGDAVRFQMPRGKREALVANGAIGDQKRRVGSVS